MRRLARVSFFSDEKGQDLIEYTLMLAFICLVGAAFYIGVGNAVGGIWSTVNTRLTDASTNAVSSGS